ncbi:YfhO family protein, partial [Candidatus Gottesmanbacteria bacterium]|nr:YfhO family protein [Candidatus Gottesmanbacteria bacterium]
YEVVRQFIQGEIFDWKRPAVSTFLVGVGFFTILLDEKLFIFALMFLLWVIMYFGRTTWGGLINLIPGLSEFHLHRFIVGIQIASLFLLPTAFSSIFRSFRKMIEWAFERIINLLKFLSQKYISGQKKEIVRVLSFDDTTKSLYQNIIYYIFVLTFVSVIFVTLVKQTIDYASFNNRWIGEANTAYQYDYHNFLDLINYLKSQPNARVYAGRPGNWGKQMRLGSTEMYMLLGVNGFDMSQFLPETWSPLSETEQNFDERVEADYDLLNIRFIVATKDEGFTPRAVLTKTFGPFKVYEVPTSGWFDVVTSDMFVKSDKTNFLNIVHIWQKSYPRVWKSYPFISLEKNPRVPDGMKRILSMQDEVTYAENGKKNNIFADFPLTFPEATVSGKILKEGVKKQSYKATVEVPQNCKQCTILLKMNYHPNWKATLNGQKVPTYAVFPFYLAIQAGPGIHEVEFTYQPNNLKVIILWLEITGLILLVVFRKKIMLLKSLRLLR